MIKEVLVVEGKSDIQRVQSALDIECIATEGFTLRKDVLKEIAIAYEKRGIIILTDPDFAGERIRSFLSKKFPKAQHAFIPLEDATANDDIGIEQASKEAIIKALKTVRVEEVESSQLVDRQFMMTHRLTGSPNSRQRRAALGAQLGIGYSNSKQFLYRLNHYRITEKELAEALQSI